MNETLTNQLVDRYPSIFPRGIYFECGDGWYDIIDMLCSDIIEKDPTGRCQATQVKEKFGALDFYINIATKDIRKSIEAASELSRSTCEFCGNPGKLREGPWLKTKCDKCAGE